MSHIIVDFYITLNFNSLPPTPCSSRKFSLSFVERALELNENLGGFCCSWQETGERTSVELQPFMVTADVLGFELMESHTGSLPAPLLVQDRGKLCSHGKLPLRGTPDLPSSCRQQWEPLVSGRP